MDKNEQQWQVEQILKKGVFKDTTYYFIKWKGFDSSDNTWQPIANLENCPDEIAKFENALRKKNKKEPAKPKKSRQSKMNISNELVKKILKEDQEQQKAKSKEESDHEGLVIESKKNKKRTAKRKLNFPSRKKVKLNEEQDNISVDRKMEGNPELCQNEKQKVESQLVSCVNKEKEIQAKIEDCDLSYIEIFIPEVPIQEAEDDKVKQQEENMVLVEMNKIEKDEVEEKQSQKCEEQIQINNNSLQNEQSTKIKQYPQISEPKEQKNVNIEVKSSEHLISLLCNQRQSQCEKFYQKIQRQLLKSIQRKEETNRLKMIDISHNLDVIEELGSVTICQQHNTTMETSFLLKLILCWISVGKVDGVWNLVPVDKLCQQSWTQIVQQME